MSIINPTQELTLIKTYANIGWDGSYRDIRLFDNAEQRTSYLDARATGVWQNCSVVKGTQSIKIQASINNLLNASYLSWDNVGMGAQRTVYAFVSGVEYINVNTTLIRYTIDWIQTWLFDFVLEACFVEREHVNDDTFGKHTLPEPFDTGEYSIHKMENHTYKTGWFAQYLSQSARDFNPVLKNGVVIATQWDAGSIDSLSRLSTVVNQLNNAGEPEKVVGICMVANSMTETGGMHESFTVENSNPVFGDGDDQYISVNKKLLCYPYQFLTVDNFEGSLQQYRYELFRNTINFAIEGTMMPKPCMICFPIEYQKWKGSSDTPNTVQQMGVLFDNFPMIPWVSDTYRAWAADNAWNIQSSKINAWVQGISGVAQVALGAATADAGTAVEGVGSVWQAYSGAKQMEQEIRNHQVHGTELHGGNSVAGMSYFRNTVGFRVTQYKIRPEIARKVDKYLTRFGYRVDDTKIPNIRGRRYCNFVKCKTASVKGAIPTDCKKVLESALEGGTTFWHVDNIGMELDSNPIV